MLISIHEAAKASTRAWYPESRIAQNFNPRSRKGFDGDAPEGDGSAEDFNPRSRKGFDLQRFISAHIFDTISIHEAAKASTISDDINIHVTVISIHEAAKASTGIDWGELGRNIDFNPRSRKGFDHNHKYYLYQLFYFNPRSRKGFDLL